MLAPTWVKLATHLAPRLEEVMVVEVDCTKLGDICREQGVQAYPTLVWYANGAKIDTFEGDRTFAGLLAYVEGKIGTIAAAELPFVSKEASGVGGMPPAAL